MKNLISNFFKNFKKTKSKIPPNTNDFWRVNPDINVNPDIAFYKPFSKKLEKLKSLIDIPKYNEIEFEENIEDFPLTDISPDARKRIIQIIKEDRISRIDPERNPVKLNKQKKNKL